MASRHGVKHESNSESRRSSIEADISAFLARGGKIESVPEGVSGEKDWHPHEGEYRPCTRVQIQLPVSYGSL